jgi:hypothetical protein
MARGISHVAHVLRFVFVASVAAYHQVSLPPVQSLVAVVAAKQIYILKEWKNPTQLIPCEALQYRPLTRDARYLSASLLWQGLELTRSSVTIVVPTQVHLWWDLKEGG